MPYFGYWFYFKSQVFLFFVQKILFFMIKNILRVFPDTSSRGLVDKIWDYYEFDHVFKSHAPTLFICLPQNILRSNLNFSTSYGRSTDLKSLSGLLLVSFIWLGEKISLKYLLIGGERLSPNVQTMSTSLMSKVDIVK